MFKALLKGLPGCLSFYWIPHSISSSFSAFFLQWHCHVSCTQKTANAIHDDCTMSCTRTCTAHVSAHSVLYTFIIRVISHSMAGNWRHLAPVYLIFQNSFYSCLLVSCFPKASKKDRHCCKQPFHHCCKKAVLWNLWLFHVWERRQEAGTGPWWLVNPSNDEHYYNILLYWPCSCKLLGLQLFPLSCHLLQLGVMALTFHVYIPSGAQSNGPTL